MPSKIRQNLLALTENSLIERLVEWKNHGFSTTREQIMWRKKIIERKTYSRFFKQKINPYKSN